MATARSGWTSTPTTCSGATSGWVTGITRPVHIGRSTQVWQIDMRNDAGELTCVSRITMAVLAPK